MKETKLKILTETQNYAVINCSGGNEGHPDWGHAMNSMLETCELLNEKGYRPLHYVPRVSAWVCEKIKGRLKAAA